MKRFEFFIEKTELFKLSFSFLRSDIKYQMIEKLHCNGNNFIKANHHYLKTEAEKNDEIYSLYYITCEK